MTLSGHFWTLRQYLSGLAEPGLPRDLREFRQASLASQTPSFELSGALLDAESDELLVVLHGLGGSIHSAYMPRALRAARACGIATLLLNTRGAGPRDVGIAHAGLTEDLAACLTSPELVRYRKLYLLGYSMGGHVALCYAAAQPDTRLRAVAAACSPLDLEAAMRSFDRPRYSVYRGHVLGGLVAGYERWWRRGGAPVAIERVRGIKTIRQWDERVVVPVFGFASVWDYYAAESARHSLDRLEAPCLYVGARQDPMVPEATLHETLAVSRARLAVHWAAGGHLAFSRSFRLAAEGEPGFERQVIAWLRRQ